MICISLSLQFSKFLSIINKNLVDSNMFIRALILSLDFFCNQPKDKASDGSRKEQTGERYVIYKNGPIEFS